MDSNIVRSLVTPSVYDVDNETFIQPGVPLEIIVNSIPVFPLGTQIVSSGSITVEVVDLVVGVERDVHSDDSFIGNNISYAITLRVTSPTDGSAVITFGPNMGLSYNNGSFDTFLGNFLLTTTNVNLTAGVPANVGPLTSGLNIINVGEVNTAYGDGTTGRLSAITAAGGELEITVDFTPA